jgi:hypothetical protein
LSKTFKIIIGLILCITVLFAVAYASREYWLGSIIIYAISDSADRNNLNSTPEKHEITISNNTNCSEYVFYGYKMCLPWNGVQEQIPGGGEAVGWVRFKDGPMIVVSNPEFERNIRTGFSKYFGEGKFSNIPKKHAAELKSIAATTLTSSRYEFFEKTLYSTFEDYKFFTPYKKVYSELILIQSKIHTCRLATNVYSEKILAFETEHTKGFQINFGPYKEGRFYDLYLFPTNSEYIKITIVGYEEQVKQADIDLIISNIKKK